MTGAVDLGLWAVILGSLCAYAVLGGADFGGGVWDLLARGPRKEALRGAIARAIGPVWEANHVWLILSVVLLFGGYPRAFAVVATALHVPLTLFVLGVVFRGSAFAFHGGARGRWEHAFTRAFGIASLLGPLLLGVCAGTVASGAVRADGFVVTSGFFEPWLRPFPWAVGVLCLGSCALLAAVFLSVETEGDLQAAFRHRAFAAFGAQLGAAALALALARTGAPRLYQALLTSPTAAPLLGLYLLASGGVFASLWGRRLRWARALTVAQVTSVILGWAAAQWPLLVPPDVPLSDAGGSALTRRALVWALCAGAPLLAPSLWILIRSFKSAPQPRA